MGNRAFQRPGTGPLSGPGRGFIKFSGIRVLTDPGLQDFDGAHVLPGPGKALVGNASNVV